MSTGHDAQGSSLQRMVRRSRGCAKTQARKLYPRLCFFCGCLLSRRTMTFDHLLPRSKGGRNELENLVLACCPCNVRKSDRLPSKTEIVRAAEWRGERSNHESQITEGAQNA